MSRVCVSPIAFFVMGCLATVGGRVATARAESAVSADQALELSKKTGRPIFAVAGTKT